MIPGVVDEATRSKGRTFWRLKGTSIESLAPEGRVIRPRKPEPCSPGAWTSSNRSPGASCNSVRMGRVPAIALRVWKSRSKERR